MYLYIYTRPFDFARQQSREICWKNMTLESLVTEALPKQMKQTIRRDINP